MNLLELALAGDPHADSAHLLPTTNANGDLLFTPTPLATDVQFIPEWSDDLVLWHDGVVPVGVTRLFRRLRATRITE